MFKKIGEAITKYPWAIVAIWIIILVASVPLIGVFTQNLEYDTQNFIPRDLSAIKAQEKYDEVFPSVDKSSIIVVIDSNDTLKTMLFIDALNDSVSEGSVNNITGTSSIYNIQRKALINMTPGLYKSLNEFYDNASDAHFELYNATRTVKNSSRDLYYLKDNVSGANYELRYAQKKILDSSAQMYEVRDQVVAANAGLYQINDSITDPAIISDPAALENQVVSTMMAMQGLTSDADRQRLTAIYRLGKNPPGFVIDQFVTGMITTGMSADEAKMAKEIYQMGRDPVAAAGEYVLNKALEGLDDDAKEIVREAWALGPYVTDQEYDAYVLKKACKDLNESECKTIKEIYSWGPSPDNETIGAYVLREAMKGLNDSENETIMEIYALGADASNDDLKAYVISKANDEFNLTGNNTYFAATLNLKRDLSDGELEEFADEWVYQHGITDPKIFPDSVIDSLTSGTVSLFVISSSDADDSLSSVESVKSLRENVTAILKDDKFIGLKSYVTGTTAMSVDAEGSAMKDVDNIDKISIVMILLLLGLYFRSFLSPFVPLVIIGVAIAAAFGVMGLLSTQIGIYYLVMTFMLVIMLGAGTDYCVFMLSRYAEERSKGAEIKDAVVTTVMHAGKSVASSGTTAMIGFGALMLIDQGIFRSIGLGTSIGIFISMLVAITIVPAVLTIFGDRVYWPKKLYRSEHAPVTGRLWTGITRAVLKNSKLIIVLALIVTVPAIMIYSQMTLGNDFVSMMPPDIESKVGYDIINDEFGSGAFEKAIIVVTLPTNLTDTQGNYTAASMDRIEKISMMVDDTEGVDDVYSITRPEGTTINYLDLSSYPEIEEEFYRDYIKNNTGIDGRTTVVSFSFTGSPFSEESQRTIDRIKQKISDYQGGEGQGTSMILGGSTVGIYEYQKLCTDKYAIVITCVLIGIFLVLVVLLRSVFTPFRLICTLLMSIFWTLAIFIIVFQFWMQASITWILPILLFCVLMGLGVDYDIFLVSRIREEVMKGKSEEEAIEHAVEATGTIITLCGAVMAAAFGSMIISDMMELKEFGFVLFLAIILDATLMRLVIVPSIMVLMKKYNWWMPFSSGEMKADESLKGKKD
jgi:RND superfamily putative drug exporter